MRDEGSTDLRDMDQAVGGGTDVDEGAVRHDGDNLKEEHGATSGWETENVLWF